jgi:hypothetical protein
MSRDEMIEAIVDNLEAWQKSDDSSFWGHIRNLERQYLRLRDDKEIKDIYEGSV